MPSSDTAVAPAIACLRAVRAPPGGGRGLRGGLAAQGREETGSGGSMGRVPAAEEIFMRAGSCLLFADCTAHGSAARTRAGERRFALYRYGMGWATSRYGYSPSDALRARLTEARLSILTPGQGAVLLPPGSPEVRPPASQAAPPAACPAAARR